MPLFGFSLVLLFWFRIIVYLFVYMFVPHLITAMMRMRAVMPAETPAGIGDGVDEGIRVGGCQVALAAGEKEDEGVGRGATENEMKFGGGVVRKRAKSFSRALVLLFIFYTTRIFTHLSLLIQLMVTHLQDNYFQRFDLI